MNGRHAVCAVVLLGLAACSPIGTKGTMPPPGPDGHVDASAIPDFVAIAGDDVDIVGYVARDAILRPGDAIWPVYADDLRAVVGHLYPGKGFVPAGIDPHTLPDAPFVAGPPELIKPSQPPDQVLVYVQNMSSDVVWIAVQTADKFGDDGGYWGGGYVGAGCFDVHVGSRLVVVDGDPTKAGALSAAIIFVQGSERVRADRYVVIGSDGLVAIGMGKPAWWQGSAPC